MVVSAHKIIRTTRPFEHQVIGRHASDSLIPLVHANYSLLQSILNLVLLLLILFINTALVVLWCPLHAPRALSEWSN